MRGLSALLCLGALCLVALQVSHSLPSPAELAATLQDRYPYDLLKSPCDMKHQYKDIDWYQRMWPLKTRQRTVLDVEALSLITDSVGPDGQVGLGVTHAVSHTALLVLATRATLPST